MVEAEKHLIKYKLLSFDAIHLAKMTLEIAGEFKKPKINDMVTLDNDIIKDCKNDYNIWYKGCDSQSIMRYEQSLSSDELDPDSLFKPREKE